MSHTKPLTATSTFWIRAKVAGPFGSFTAKVAFGQGRQPTCEFVPVDAQGWNFSSRESAEDWAVHAAARVYPGLSGDCAVLTEVVEES